ncbi:MAG: molybdopterin-dependent oxidoreductase [Chloroflexota bacterium]
MPNRTPMAWPSTLLTAAAAAAAAVALMFVARALSQIRTLPERVMEWALLFISPDTFEAGIQRFGQDAKYYGLYVAVAGTALILLAIGTAALRRAPTPLWLLVTAPLLYLVAMGVVMPVTGAGPFATGLFQDPLLINCWYAAIALVFAVMLVLGRWTLTPGGAAREDGGRRAFLAGAVPMLAAALGILSASQRSGGAAGSNLPLAKVELPPRTPVPSPAVAAASPAPSPTAGAVAAPAVPPTPLPVAAAAAPQPPPTLTLPVPPPGRLGLTRDKDGSATAGVRQPGQLAEAITPTEAHYHVTKNPVADPILKPEQWRLALDGDVQRPVQLDYATLRQLPSVEIAKTLECISNLTDKCELVPFGCELIGTARWRGVRLRDLINLAGGFKPGVVGLTLVGADEFLSYVPLAVATDDDTILAYEMNGAVLPYDHGYPARMLSVGRYGFKSAKWVVGIRATSREVADWYAQRDWSKEGIIKTMTRIDTPARGATAPPGALRVAGVAYAGDRGIAKVELSSDGGATWRTVRFIEPQQGRDSWVRWEAEATLPPGGMLHLVARATDGTGALQSEPFGLAQPDGASGWHHLEIRSA